MPTSSIFNVEQASSSKTWVILYWTARRHIQENPYVWQVKVV